eukprot:4779735-Amphidinium_carterae.1
MVVETLLHKAFVFSAHSNWMVLMKSLAVSFEACLLCVAHVGAGLGCTLCPGSGKQTCHLRSDEVCELMSMLQDRGSPIAASAKELETLGKNLKKNNVSLDIVSYGEIEDRTVHRC